MRSRRRNLRRRRVPGDTPHHKRDGLYRYGTAGIRLRLVSRLSLHAFEGVDCSIMYIPRDRYSIKLGSTFHVAQASPFERIGWVFGALLIPHATRRPQDLRKCH